MARADSPLAYAIVTLALLLLLALTVGMSYVNLGPFGILVAMLIALIKALLVFLFFMHLLRGTVSFRVTALFGVFMLALFGALTLSDYLARNRYAHRVHTVAAMPFSKPEPKKQ